MRYLNLFVVAAALLTSQLAPAPVSGLGSISSPAAQSQNRAQEKADSLRAQLSDVEAKQAELQTRRQDLDEQLKPENIEKALAGVGSLHPEDLREQRRRQLEIERNGVQRQLDLLATSHSRLESAIAQADADAYRQSAAPAGGPSINATPAVADSTGAAATPVATPARPRRAKKKKKTRKSKPTKSAILLNGLNGPGSQIKTIAGL
jgi:peptidoglycan hydrolase CwlO-like protein